MKQSCYCGSGLNYSACCKRYLAGRLMPSTPEALMRSRYTANVIQNIRYLFKTWHPSTRPDLSELKNIDVLEWSHLEVLSQTSAGSDTVEFIADYQQKGQVGKLHETSHFVFEKGKWFYLRGEIHLD